MSLDLLRYDPVLAVAGLAALAILLGLLWIARRRRRARRRRQEERCPTCGNELPRGAERCPRCEPKVRRVPSAELGQRPSAASSGTYELVPVEGPLTNQRYAVSPEGLTIGRHVDNDLVLSGELMVSRHHAAIAYEGGQFVLYDRDSANGTWVNERRVFRHVLVPGDRIRFWGSEFVFQRAGAPVPSPVPTASPQPTIRVEGEQFAGYFLETLIGRGGMSEVFRARDRNGRTVAVKILQQSDPYLVDKFVQEGNQIGPLLRDHPNIIYVYEFGQSPDHRLYIVMEFVDAPSLRKILRPSLEEARVVQIMGQVCGALGFAHENQVVHRDIKPENILVTEEGFAKVLDFGIAKLTSAATVTRDKIVGTPEYLSPEQARGESVRPASDVYALGIVLYEMLTGRVPFPRPRDEEPYRAAMEVIRQHLHERPTPVRKVRSNGQVSKRLERITMKALEKDVKRRYDSAKEMGAALGYREEAVNLPTPRAVRPQASLVVVRGARQGQRFRLTEQPLTLGRADLDAANTAISRQHVNVHFRGGSYWLEDTSKNGTLVDNRRVYGEVPLRIGALIVIGDNVLRLERA